MRPQDLLDEAFTDDDESIAFGRKSWADGDAASARGEYFEGSPREIMDRIRLLSQAVSSLRNSHSELLLERGVKGRPTRP